MPPLSINQPIAAYLSWLLCYTGKKAIINNSNNPYSRYWIVTHTVISHHIDHSSIAVLLLQVVQSVMLLCIDTEHSRITQWQNIYISVDWNLVSIHNSNI